MPRNTRSPCPPLRQRVTWEDATFGELEILEDTFTLTQTPCPTCGRGMWTADPEHNYLCTRCQMLVYAGGEMEPVGGFWVTVVRQLQLAEQRAS